MCCEGIILEDEVEEFSELGVAAAINFQYEYTDVCVLSISVRTCWLINDG